MRAVAVYAPASFFAGAEEPEPDDAEPALDETDEDCPDDGAGAWTTRWEAAAEAIFNQIVLSDGVDAADFYQTK